MQQQEHAELHVRHEQLQQALRQHEQQVRTPSSLSNRNLRQKHLGLQCPISPLSFMVSLCSRAGMCLYLTHSLSCRALLGWLAVPRLRRAAIVPHLPMGRAACRQRRIPRMQKATMRTPYSTGRSACMMW